jgi:arylsulfatase A-like enzyme
MSRAKPLRGEDVPTNPRTSANLATLEGWIAIGLCGLVLLASTAILKRSRDFSRTVSELGHGNGRGPARTSANRRGEPHTKLEFVLVLSLDGLRPERLTTPNLAALAGESQVFGAALAQAPQTLTSHKSLFTGKYPTTLLLEQTGADPVELAALREPRTFLVDALARVRPGLAEGFRTRGYRTAAFTDGTWLEAAEGFEPGFELFDDTGGGLATIAPRALAWLDREHTRPTFLFLHADDLTARGASADVAATRYEAALVGLDQALGILLDGLRLRGRYESGLLVITAGHGRGLGERVQPGGLFLEELHVPLVLKFPQELELEPAVLDEPVELVDLLPTLFAQCGVPLPEDLDGRSLLPTILRGVHGRDYLIAQSPFEEAPGGAASPAARTLVRPGRWQVIHDLARAQASFFDLRADPGGLAPHPVAAAELSPLLDLLLARGAHQAHERLRPPEPASFSAELEHELEALGYAAGAVAGDGPTGSLR